MMRVSFFMEKHVGHRILIDDWSLAKIEFQSSIGVVRVFLPEKKRRQCSRSVFICGWRFLT